MEVELLKNPLVDNELLLNLPSNKNHQSTETSFRIGVSAINWYFRNNFVGPPLPVLEQIYQQYRFQSDYRALEAARDLILLDIGSEELQKEDVFASYPSSAWWLIRALWLQQRSLTEPNVTLRDRIFQLEGDFRASAFFASLSADFQMEFNVELAVVLLYYYEYERANAALLEAKTLRGGLTIELTGQMGKRTKFQQKEVSQLTTDIRRELNWEVTKEVPAGELPTNCRLQDDTLLETVAFTDVRSDSTLASADQVVVLAVCVNQAKTDPDEVIRQERLVAFLTKLLSDARNYAVQYCALYHRCCLERQSTKRVERAMAQLEQMTTDFQMENASFNYRATLAFAANLPAIWEVQKLHADILLTLGCVREALGIYEKLKLWDDVVECYKASNKLDRAETLVRRLIDVEKPNPLHYCLLGDITVNREHYETAWKLSNSTCARAQQCLGRLLLSRGQLAEALECYSRAVAVQPLIYNCWYNLGYCALQLKRYTEAADAYRHCVRIEPDSFHACNNLAAAYLHMGDKQKALLALKDAVRHNYDSARTWENLLSAAVDCGQTADAITAYHRLLDLDSQFIDSEALRLTTETVLRGDNRTSNEGQDTGGASAELDRTSVASLKKLFGRVQASGNVDGIVWRSYARLYEMTGDMKTDSEDRRKMVFLLQKAYLADSQKLNWNTVSDETCLSVVTSALQYLTALTEASVGDDETARRNKASAKMTAKSLLANLRRRQETKIDLETDDTGGTLRTCVEKLESYSL